MMERQVDSIKDLVTHLKYNCYRNDSIHVGSFGIKGNDGFSVEFNEKEYDFYYQERGHKRFLKKFTSEKEMCNYVVRTLEKDRSNRQHCIKFTRSKAKAERFVNRLNKWGIEYIMDKIPYEGENNFRYRIFVFGRDLKRSRFLRLL